MIQIFHDTDMTLYRHAEYEIVTYSITRNIALQEYPIEIRSPTLFFTLRTWADLFIRRSESFTELIKDTLISFFRVLPLDEYG